MSKPLLTVENLRADIRMPDGVLSAVDGMDLTVTRGETVCLVGESGSGKSLTCDSITGLVSSRKIDVSGSVRFDGEALLEADEATLRTIRGNRIAYLFQNSHNALDPVYSIGNQIVEAITFHDDDPEPEPREQAIELLETVGLSRPGERVDSYPHELSQGMRQRVALAIALAADPDLLIADEPTSALDVTIQARILELLEQLKRERDLTVLLVTHDLRVVARLADRVVVMYAGQPVERGPVDAVFETPAHPYTQALFDSFTGTTQKTHEQPAATGCRFASECPHAVDDCRTERPAFEAVGTDETTSHQAACIYYRDGRDRSKVLERATGVATAADSLLEVSDGE
ncbi:ABC transporter ATP-binding protein [Halobacteria archaeon AArc-curdl1]|uniref:Nickel import system ATP-binding protein NikD n=1 Tax=Natronosalvus hydrolyticus TaxID=2979988 RepID=A0AAP2Z5J6_9EURY|nr:ABC transporter ATP-binding protein [Halobacteria archaeon AArc-curdl1]